MEGERFAKQKVSKEEVEEGPTEHVKLKQEEREEEENYGQNEGNTLTAYLAPLEDVLVKKELVVCVKHEVQPEGSTEETKTLMKTSSFARNKENENIDNLNLAQPEDILVNKNRQVFSANDVVMKTNNEFEVHSAENPIKQKFKKEINILLLGETGVGKSTVINAFANYFAYENLCDAENGGLISLIPSKFVVTDENYEARTIEIGQSENEAQKVGASATQNAKSYVFPFDDNTGIRLIDTPGIGDTRGAEQDNCNFDHLLACLGEFKEIHAICILLKSNNARITVMFEYCIKQLLSRLEKSASRNIVFLFTNSRSTFYRPGDTLPSLKEILEGTQNAPPYVKIPLSKENIYCIDNEAFRFLVALIHGVKFGKREKDDFEASWEKSSEECWRLLEYIIKLTPHKIQDTLSINEARRLIMQLAQPLADIAYLIQTNIEILQRRKEVIAFYSDDIEKLKKNLYIPFTNIRVDDLPKPRTVCAAKKCCEVHQVNERKIYHHKQSCHDPCSLKKVPKEIIGAPELLKCSAIVPNQNCEVCGCSYLQHMHIYYQSHAYEDNTVDESVKSQITNKENAKRTAEIVTKEIAEKQGQYEKEQDTILKSTAKFANFLQNNAITPYNDAYQRYLEYLIDREYSRDDSQMANNFQNMLKKYIEEKKILDNALKLAKQGTITTTSFITAEDVMDVVKQLYNLSQFGPKIKEMFHKQNRAKSTEKFIEREVHVSNHNQKRSKRFQNIASTVFKTAKKFRRGDPLKRLPKLP